jgi:uncharacterized membrane protein YebE (DUF533 family)
MFNAEQMLGNLLQDTLSDTIGFGGRRKKGKKKRKRRGLGGFGKGALVGAGAAGLAALAYQHFSGKGQQAARSPQLAEQIYEVSCLAIDVDTDAERRYLQTLGQTLGLSPGTVATLNDQLGVD